MIFCTFDTQFAVKTTVNEAMVYQALRDIKSLDFDGNFVQVVDDKHWIKGSVNSIKTIRLPFLSHKQISTALTKLCKRGILQRSTLQTNHLNRTYWYTILQA